jgi:hypothetical protein
VSRAAHKILRRKLALLWAQGRWDDAIGLGAKLDDAGVAPVNLSRLGELFPGLRSHARLTRGTE